MSAATMVAITEGQGAPPTPAGISVPAAIIIGLIASFVQSLGLTIQRKSHMQNALLPEDQQRSDWRRKAWVSGFVIFVSANIGGTVFQIGALPIVMLAPLGAVSLLFNALLARFLLDDFFSSYMLIGTALITVGAVLIGYFGVVQEPPHSLDELIALYGRPAFVVFASLFALFFLGVLAMAHLAEWQLHVRLFRPRDPELALRRKSMNKKRKKLIPRRWSTSSLAPVAEVSESNSGIATPVLEIADEAARRGIPVDRLLLQRGKTSSSAQNSPAKPKKTRNYGSTAMSPHLISDESRSTEGGLGKTYSTSAAAVLAAAHDPAVGKTCLGLAIAYGGASGTLSGACLLLAKSGVELLVLTISGKNQFDRWQSWFLVLVMLFAALLQLWYLNKSLRLASPPLVCPLAFCFYNTSSIALGLVYFNQVGALSVTSLLAVVLGTGVLLAGVWIVSMHGAPAPMGKGGDQDEETAPLLGIGATESSSQPPSEDQILSSPQSQYSAEQLEQSEALLANAAGIAGPHLPPQSVLTRSPEAVSSPSAMSPSSSNIGNGRKTRNRHRRAKSAQASLMGGFGFYLPGLPTQPAPEPLVESQEQSHDSSVERASEGQSSVADVEHRRHSRRRGSMPAASQTRSPPSQLTLLSSPSSRRRGLYDTLLERGLSIGLSPSSPGFHVRSSFEVEENALGIHQRQDLNPRLVPQRARDRISGLAQRRSLSETESADRGA